MDHKAQYFSYNFSITCRLWPARNAERQEEQNESLVQNWRGFCIRFTFANIWCTNYPSSIYGGMCLQQKVFPRKSSAVNSSCGADGNKPRALRAVSIQTHSARRNWPSVFRSNLSLRGRGMRINPAREPQKKFARRAPAGFVIGIVRDRRAPPQSPAADIYLFIILRLH
jgi:hypothetical protein